jgi:hypothetical protein
LETDLGQAIWEFMKRPENRCERKPPRISIGRPFPFAPGLLRMFGPEIAEDRLEQSRHVHHSGLIWIQNTAASPFNLRLDAQMPAEANTAKTPLRKCANAST